MICLCSAISFESSRRELSIDVAEHRSTFKNKGVMRILVIFKIDLSSAISFKRSRRELSIDVAEHRSTLKNKGVMRIMVIFQDRPMFSHIIQKVSARAFHWCGWTEVHIEKSPKYVSPRFGFTLKTSIAFPKKWICFYRVNPNNLVKNKSGLNMRDSPHPQYAVETGAYKRHWNLSWNTVRCVRTVSSNLIMHSWKTVYPTIRFDITSQSAYT